MNKKPLVLLLILLLSLSLVACGNSSETEENVDAVVEVEKKVVFADASWDSIRLHNVIAGYILEKGYGYEVEMIPARRNVAQTTILRIRSSLSGSSTSMMFSVRS